MSKEEKVIMYESDEAAKHTNTAEGWLDIRGVLWYSEHSARFSSATHIKCKTDGCESIVNIRGIASCDECRAVNDLRRYNEMPYLEWDNETPLYDMNSDNYFFSVEDIEDYMHEEAATLSDFKFIICEPINWRYLEEDYFTKDQHEDAEAPDQLAEAIDSLNKIVADLNSNNIGCGYIPSKNRTTYKRS